MEGGATTYEKDCGALGGLFQTIINDMRGSSPIWEDFASKALKLHTSLKSTVVAIGAFLEAFQKVADMATGSKGATKEIGSALTRLCLRHRSIESHLKIFTSSITDNLVAPLQDKLEDWKKAVAQIDKDHAKEHKKARQDIKKAASDTMRLQKKVKKGGGSQHGHHKSSEMQAKLDVSMQEVNAKYNVLEDTMKSSVRTALIEERSRFCHFITCLKPFVDGELKLLTEISNISEIMHSLCLQASEPSVLPASSEQVILDLKGLDNSAWNLHQPSPPSSPSSLGSRKSSMCSINSINSSSSGSSKSHSPSHTMHKRTPSQHPHQAPSTIRLTSVSSQDSGFTSQDTLFHRPQTPPQSLNLWQTSSTNQESQGEGGDCDSTPTTPSDNTPSASSTWNNWPNPPGGANNKVDPSRPHTISSAYEKGHGRPALKPDMFEPPPGGVEMRPKPARQDRHHSQSSTGSVSSISSTGSNSSHRPSATISKMQPVLPPHCPKAKVKAVAPPMLPQGVHQQPIYANAQITQQSPDDGEPTTPTTPAGMTQAFPALTSPSTEVTLMALDQAFEQMVGIAGIPEEEEIADDSQEVITPRASTSSSNGTPGTPGRGSTSSIFAESLVECHKPKIQADTSLELAKAIRELEASTAALTSAYDHQDSHQPSSNASVNNSTGSMPVMTGAGTSNGGGGGDSDSYTSSKSSLPCSSGYGTMTSTPAGSEDTIASGDCTLLAQSDPFDSDKPCTLPRSSGEQGKLKGKGPTYTQSGYKPPINPKRPSSTTGIPSSSSLSRRSSSSSTSKPPPPIRRTASVKSASLPQNQVRQSPQRQMSEGAQHGIRSEDGAYAELQLIQQKIQQQQQQHMAPHSAGYDGSEDMQRQHQAVQDSGQSQTTTALQNLNAKFASLNNQYRDGSGNSGNVALEYQQQQQQSSGNGVGSGPPQVQTKPTNGPPMVKQKPKMVAVPPPPSVTMGDPHHHHHYLQQQQQQQQQHPHAIYNNNGNNYHQGNQGAVLQLQQQQQQHQQHPYHSQQQHQQQRQLQHQPQHLHHQQPHQHHPYHHRQQSHLQHQQQHSHQSTHHPGEEDFPLPPTVEELQEMERIYSCSHPGPPPPPSQSTVGRIGGPPSTKPPQALPTHQAPTRQMSQPSQPTQAMPPPDSQHSLMQELKRRVSVDTNASSDA